MAATRKILFADDTEDVNGARYVALLSASPAVYAILCGHVHGYVKTEFAEGKPQICASQGMIGFVDRLTVRGL